MGRITSQLPGVVAVGVLLSAGAWWFVHGQPRVAVDSQPIVLHADEVATWKEKGQRIVLLRGTVLVEQGLTHVRCNDAVAWITEESKQRQLKTSRVVLYAEGNVLLEKDGDSQVTIKTLVELATQGELRIRSQKNKVIQEARANDPVVQRGVMERLPKPVAVLPEKPEPVIRRVVHEEPPAPTWPTAAPSNPGTMPPMIVPPTPADAATPAGPLSGATPGVPPAGPRVPADRAGPARVLSIAPRYARTFETQSFPLANGEQGIVVTGGVILVVRNLQNVGLVDIEADQMVLWTRSNGSGSGNMLQEMQSTQGKVSREMEFYLAGNVVIRHEAEGVSRTLRADEAYYDVNRNVAIAVSADLEFTQPGLRDPVHVRADEVTQLSPTLFEATRAEIFSSKLPSDPGLKVLVAHATVEQVQTQRRSIFGRTVINRDTGQPLGETEHLIRSRNVIVEVEDFPIFYAPFAQGSAEHPLGPLRDVNIGFNRIYGAQIGAAFDTYDLLGLQPVEGTRWTVEADYLTRRGPALGTDFDYSGRDLFGIHSRYEGRARFFGMHDDANDILGGTRNDVPHPEWRGRSRWQHRWWDMPYGFSFLSQFTAITDKNFIEQYYKQEWDTDIDQDTFAYLKQQNDNWAWTLLVEPRVTRHWLTTTEWLPRADGYLLGQSFFNLFTYNVMASAGYAQLRPTEEPPPPVQATQVRVDTGRLDLWQEISLPFTLGAFRIVPYAVLDLTAYSEDLTGNEQGRVIGGAGIRGSMPLTRLYPDVHSDLLNLNGINHKIVFASNFVSLASDTPFNQLPQLDELHDDATDQAIRDFFPVQFLYNPENALVLTTSPLFNPQRYAIRRLADSAIDTRDDIEVLQLDIRQRWQTKRGYPGMQHIVDWMILELSGSYFPRQDRDNFGEALAFLEYDWTWNIGDRTTLVSTGWLDPIEDGPRVFTIGGYFNRPDRTNFFLGYRQIDPVDSRAVTGALTYILSPKYAMTASTTYDFGTNEALSNSLMFTRMGSDVQFSLGVTYNAMQNNFGAAVYIIPNLIANKVGPLAKPSTSRGMFQ